MLFPMFQRGWRPEGGHFVFKELGSGKTEQRNIPAVDLARNDIFYAKQLEMIV